MLDELHVSNIALIEDATLGFDAGLTVLTGETGAGKTALLAALKLICGARADSTVVRDGADEAVAEARFIDSEERIVRRRVSANGRSRCSIDGAMATVGQLAEASSCIEVHGQHEQVLLLEPARQLAYLDSWLDDETCLERYAQTRAAYIQARDALDAFEQARDQSARELEFMRFTLEQIDKSAPVEGEYEQLEEDLPRLQHADELSQAVQEALAALHDDQGALDMIARSSMALGRQTGIDEGLDNLNSRLSSLENELDDLARDLNAYARSIDADPYKLEKTLDRLDELSGLMKRFGPGMDQVFAAWRQAQSVLESAESSPLREQAAKEEVENAESAYRDAAADLEERRHAAATRFCAQLADAVAELAMQGAGFEFAFAPLPFERWSEAGSEQIELLYRPAPSAKARPLRRIASGGELSRILLALECLHYGVAASEQGSATIVFDEVDAGIGGATGMAVARRLAMLSRAVQVIVVTHLPQVAALADEHYVVNRQNSIDTLPQTTVERVTGEQRVAEIARMLAGDDDRTARDHARSLLSGTAEL
jgi:DNA repair protein RecN (Recombination protein N)